MPLWYNARHVRRDATRRRVRQAAAAIPTAASRRVGHFQCDCRSSVHLVAWSYPRKQRLQSVRSRRRSQVARRVCTYRISVVSRSWRSVVLQFASPFLPPHAASHHSAGGGRAGTGSLAGSVGSPARIGIVMLGMFGIGPTEILIAAAVVVVLMAIQGWLRPPEKR